jgi:NAD(P)-dependent dehydrogenase (short-subunit alcohol dehydrogenase family)
MNGLDLRALFSLDGKIALVTGGSRGIGYMISQGLLQAGARVYITARDADACRGAAGELGRIGPGAKASSISWSTTRAPPGETVMRTTPRRPSTRSSA